MVEEPTAASVLIVDDEFGPRESIRLVLEARFRVTTAESGEQALDVLRNHRVDVVTLDLMMPGMGGIATFRKIREMYSDVEIIVISADGVSFESVAQTLPRRAFAWIAKPFEAAQLVQAVGRAAERSRIGRLRAERPQAPVVREVGARVEVTAQSQHDGARIFSHDIKNRLNVVLGFVHMLREDPLDSAHAARALDAIEGSAHEAMTLAVNFLHAEESDGGSLHLHKTPTSLNQIVEQVLKDETPCARSRRIALQADLDSGLPLVDLDIAMISSALANLLNNALHYSSEEGIVRVETRRFDDEVILRVRDYGPGIPADEMPLLFQRYGRGAKSASRSSTGLGLYLVRTIVEAHGGSVSVTLPADGGSAFVLVFPCVSDDNA